METQVIVIGGGITGAGILRDLAMRGIDGVLVEKGDLANGTSARFHGLLHSGARYAVKDPVSARDCILENKIQKKAASGCIQDIGGFFVQLSGDDPDYVKEWQTSCADIGINIEEIDPKELLVQEPALNRNLVRAFRVPDAAVDGFKLVRENISSARRFGARVLTYTEVVSIHILSGTVCGITARKHSGEEIYISCQFIINAAGPWTGEIASLAGLELEKILNKGTLLVFNQPLTQRIINRCQAPGDGDIFVPHHSVTIYGTTSEKVGDAGCDRVTFQEIMGLLDIGEAIIPSLKDARIIRAFAGVRPLYQPEGEREDGYSREITRDFFLLDHQEKDGLAGFVSIVGGKFTTYRLMAERTVDLICKKIGNTVPCLTAQENLVPDFLEDLVKEDEGEEVICECEQISETELKQALLGEEPLTLNGLRRRTRMGMGTCQGTFCTYRSLGVLNKYTSASSDTILEMVQGLIEERWKGMRPVLWGPTMKEGELMRRIYGDILNMEGLE